MTTARVRFEADSLMAAAETQIVRLEYARSLREPSWDGYCGLVPVCEDECRADNVFVRAGWSTTGTSMYTAAPSTPGAASASSSFGEPRARPGHAAAGHRRTLSAESSGLTRAPALALPPAGARAQPRPPERPHPHVPDAAAGDARTQRAHPLLARLAAEEARLRGDTGAAGQSADPAGRPPDLPAARLAALADEAFRAAAATLARGDAAAAAALLELAARAVPAGHPRAAAKIAALLATARAGAAAGAPAPDAPAARPAPGEVPAGPPEPVREEAWGPEQDPGAEVAAAAAGAVGAPRDAGLHEAGTAGQGGHAAAQTAAADPRERSAAGSAAGGGAAQPGGEGAAEGRGRAAGGAEPAQAPASGQAGAGLSVGIGAGEASEGAARAPGGAPSAEPAAGPTGTSSGGSAAAPAARGLKATGDESPAVATAETRCAEPPAGVPAREAGAADAHFGAAVDALQRREYAAAVRRLEAARDACPLDRPAALAKINRYLAAVGAKLTR